MPNRRLYYLKGSKPVPVDYITHWYVVDRQATLVFHPDAFEDGRTSMSVDYESEEAALKDMNLLQEWWEK